MFRLWIYYTFSINLSRGSSYYFRPLAVADKKKQAPNNGLVVSWYRRFKQAECDDLVPLKTKTADDKVSVLTENQGQRDDSWLIGIKPLSHRLLVSLHMTVIFRRLACLPNIYTCRVTWTVLKIMSSGTITLSFRTLITLLNCSPMLCWWCISLNVTLMFHYCDMFKWRERLL